MNNEFLGIHWAAWQRMWLLLLLPLVIVIIIWAFIKRKNAIRLLAHKQWQSLFVLHWSPIKACIKMVLLSLAIFLLLIAFAQPQWNKREQIVEQEGRDLLIALDVSRSMLAQDFKPSRLEFAKKKIHSLVDQLKAERVGLILFSGSAFIQCPLTSDYPAFFLFLDQVDAETIASGTTAMDVALSRALEVYSKIPERKYKLLVIFTDGEDFSSNMAAIKQRAAQLGIKIFTIGIGTEQGGPIPVYDDFGRQVGHQKDKDGSVVISRLNQALLESLAESFDGMFIKASYDESDLHALIDKVRQFEKEKIEDKKITTYDEGYPYFVATSILLLLLEWII